MRLGFYSKLAVDGIRKNKRLYLPYFITGIVMVMMFYIVTFLSEMELLRYMKGGATLRMMLPLGSKIILVFALIFLFYSNSFLVRQRYKEFGLYNILGMDKKNLGRIVFFENLMSALVAIIIGLFLGGALSKVAELGMLNLMDQEIEYSFRLEAGVIYDAILYFSGIYLVLFLHSLIKIRRSNPLELLRSSQVGEKAPKANWLVALLGVILLAVAYYIAVSIENPLSAMVWFFIAVIMVIIATYMVFVAGSVAFCKLLQKNKKYYYKANHFVSVSSMVYRMKRNGAGLASICILLTMVLVMLSSTVSLYIGAEDSYNRRYPNEISLKLPVPTLDEFKEETFSHYKNTISQYVKDVEKESYYANAGISGLLTKTGVLVDQQAHAQFSFDTVSSLVYIQILPLSEYNRLHGTDYTLGQGECLLHCLNAEYNGDTFTIEGADTLKVKKVVDKMMISGELAMQMIPAVTVITDEFEAVMAPLMKYESEYGDHLAELYWNYGFDVAGSDEEEIAVYDVLRKNMSDIVIHNEDGSYYFSIDSRAEGKAEFFGLYSGLFFVGILLSIVFLFAAVLIIYYKQISEGYEDRNRFEVMQKVGMMKRDIKKCINSQVLTVFFLPLLAAGVHLSFAFPLVFRLLQLFNLNNLSLMIVVSLATYFVFALVYALVYKITSNAYYAIVSERR
ncbi:MAG: ABC transporter permease [Lachnospiraceae bacterium]|nr:ABC transporter permease [Lachnospiraceae bacterium]